MPKSTEHLADIKRAWLWALALGGAMAAIGATLVIAAVVAGDQVMRATDPAPALWFGTTIAVALFMTVLIVHLRRRILERAALWVDHTIARDIVAASLNDTPARHVGALRQALANGTAAIAVDAIWLPAFAVALATIDARAALLAAAAIAIGYGLVLIGASGHAAGDGETAEAHAGSIATVAARNASLVRSLSLENAVLTSWTDARTAAVGSNYAHLISVGRRHLLANLFTTLALVSVAAYAFAGVHDGSLGRLEAVVTACTIGWIIARLRAAIASSADFRNARAVWRALVKRSRTPARTAPSSEIGAIRLDDATVVHESRRYAAIEHADMTCRPGEVIVISGPSGAGKSTLAALIAGALKPTSGRAERGSLRIGFVPELPLLLDGTVAQNIARFARHEAPAIVAAADRAGVRHIVENLGLETPIRPDLMTTAGTLSLREARAVTMARAAYAPIDLLVLDKPELALDTYDVQALVAALQRLRETGIGLVLATNDPRFQPLADRVVHLDAGRIVGSPASMRRDPLPQAVRQPARLVGGRQFAAAR